MDIYFISRLRTVCIDKIGKQNSWREMLEEKYETKSVPALRWKAEPESKSGKYQI